MRNEEQQLLVDELRKTPEFNNIYFERDFDGINFQGFNILKSSGAQNTKILENIGNSQSLTETFNSSCNAWAFTNEDGIKDDPRNNIQRCLRINCLYDGTLKWSKNGTLMIVDMTTVNGQGQGVIKVFEIDNNSNGSFLFSAGNILDVYMYDGSPANIQVIYKSYKKASVTEDDLKLNEIFTPEQPRVYTFSFICEHDGYLNVFLKSGAISVETYDNSNNRIIGNPEKSKLNSFKIYSGKSVTITEQTQSPGHGGPGRPGRPEQPSPDEENTKFIANIFYNKLPVNFSYTNQEVQVQPPNKSFTINKEHAAFKVINKCTMMIAANPFTYVYYNNTLTPLRAFNAKENDTFEIWNFDKDWETEVLETEDQNYTLKKCIELFHSIPKNSVNPGAITLSLNYTLQQANPLTILERLIAKSKEINKNAPLPLYIDNSIDLNEYKSRFKDQMLDLFLNLQGANAANAFSYKSGVFFVKYVIISSSNDISKIFNGNSSLLEVDIFNIGPNCNAEKAFYDCASLQKVTIHKVEGQNNTDFIFGRCIPLAQKLGQDKMIEILKKLGAYDDWYNGINRSHFFGCPYNGTILAKFASYDKQKENNFNPHWLIPEQLSKEDIREDAGYYNTNGKAKMWPDWKPTYENDDVFPVKIEIGSSDGGSTQDTTTSYITIDDKKKYAMGRGHTIAWFKPSDTATIEYNYIDTYDAANSGKFAQTLTGIPSGYVVVITSSDATSVSAQDREALKLFGSVRNDTWEPRRFAHMFIGWRGVPSDQVYEYVGTGIESVKKDIVVSVPSDNKNFLFNKTVEYPRAIVPASRVDCWPFVLKNIKSLWESCGFAKTKDKEFDVSFYIQWKSENTEFSKKFNENLKKSWSTDDPFNIHLRELQPIGGDKGTVRSLFSGIEWLKTIDISSENIGYMTQAFSYCKNLKSVKGKINSKENIGRFANYLFEASFTNVENPDLSNFECHFNEVQGCFFKSGVTKVDWFSKWEGVKHAEGIFIGCNKLIKINTKIFPSTVTSIIGAFSYCENLEEVQGGWVEPNSSLYYQNYTLSEVTLEQVKDFENPVYKEGLIIPPSAEYATALFCGCKKLKSVKDLKLSKRNNDRCFEKCRSLKEVYNVNLNNGSAVDAFHSCPQNKDYRIWLPIIVNSTTPYDKNNFLDTGLSIEHVKQFFVDDNFIFVDGKYEPFDAQRRINYENAINPERAFVFKYFTHPHADYHDIWGWNTIHDANVYYDGDVTSKVKV